MGMRISREGVSGNNAVQFQSCDDSNCTALGENGYTDMAPTNCEIPVWSENGAGNLLKCETMYMTKAVVSDCLW